MKTRLTEDQIRRFYRLLSVRMTDFDCGALCAPRNGGVPYCCDSRHVTPILFRREFAWQRRLGPFWKKMPIESPADRRMVEEICDYNIFAVCPGPARCRRSRRALVCRTYPFEPHVDNNGRVLGLVYQDERNTGCALSGKPRSRYNPVYLRNALIVWREILAAIPEERELYTAESRRRERRARREKKPFRLFA
ncbi:MAG: hypothetical protein JW951_01450 [Lentisphaerae bacterium]|nr:hypothetical protein [Lentisphaerota bacterium]